VGKVLLSFPQEIARKEKISLDEIEGVLNTDVLSSVLENVKSGKLGEGDIKHVLTNLVSGKNLKEALKLEKESLNMVEEKIMKIINGKPNLSANAYMGLVMKEFKGKVNGKQVMEIIGKHLKQ
jgi:Glu-tRNA(Gln) amidotransferase subunit E-like FAD-binding protein